MTTKTSPPIKTFETIDIEFNLNDRVLHWSPNGKYICYSTNKHIFVMNMNTKLLNDMDNGCFQTANSSDVNKTHGVQSLNKMMPLKYFYRLLSMDDMSSLVCNPLIPSSPLSTDHTEIKKLAWSLSCSFQSEQNLLGALNSLGNLEILSCSSSSGLEKISNISHLWYAHCHKAYFKKYPLPKASKLVRDVYYNFARLLFIESFVWIPASSSESVTRCDLVCYHKLGIVSVWNFVESRSDAGVVEKEEAARAESIKTTPTKKCKNPPPPPTSSSRASDSYCYKCKLVKVITKHFIEPPFSVKRLFGNEIKSSNERILNIEYVRLGDSKDCLSVSKADGTIDLLQFEDKDIKTNETLIDTTMNTSDVNITLDVKANETMDTSFSNTSNDDITEDVNDIGNDNNNTRHVKITSNRAGNPDSLDTTIALNEHDNSIANGTDNESIAYDESVAENAASLVNNKITSLKRTSSCKENDVVLENTNKDVENNDLVHLEQEETVKMNSNNNTNVKIGHLEVNKMNGKTTLEDENVNNEHIKVEQQLKGNNKLGEKRKRDTFGADIEQVRNKRMRLAEYIENEFNGFDKEQVRNKRMKLVEYIENEFNGFDNELETSINEHGNTADITSRNEDNGLNENGAKNIANAVEGEIQRGNHESDIGKTDEANGEWSQTKSILSEKINTNMESDSSLCIDGKVSPAVKYIVYDKTDNILVSNLMVSYIGDNVLIVFSKLSYICYVLLNKQGKVLESNQIRIQTRLITAMTKFVKNKYLVLTFESKVLIVSIGGRRTEIGQDSNESVVTRDSICGINETLNESIQSERKDKSIDLEVIANTNDKSIANTNDKLETSESTLDLTNKQTSTNSSCKHISIVVRRCIDLSNATHTINGIANSTNNFLTVISFRIKVKFENYCKSSRNPAQLALTSFHSANGLLSSQLPNLGSSVYKQIDMLKFINLNNINFFRLNSICINLQNVQLKYFLVKLFKPKHSEGKNSHFMQVLEQLEKTIFLNHIKKCVRDGIFREDRQVLILFREWIKLEFPGDKYNLKKLNSCFPTEEYKEICVICSSQISRVESFHYAVCNDKHRVLRCSLSLLQCLRSYVQCQYCLAFASKKYASIARCVFCDALFPVN